jgi:cation:H+ antiporter
MSDPLLVLVGAALLFAGGEVLVGSAGKLARAWGMSPLAVGITVVAFATSSPELAAILMASIRGSAEVALGAVVGSNISNIGLILGFTALIAPVAARARFLRREVPFMLGVTLLLFAVTWNGRVGPIEGAGLLALLGVYLAVLLRTDEKVEVEEEFAGRYRRDSFPVWRALLGVTLGVALLTGGAWSLVEGAVGLAAGLGISERVIGITVVALGTSLPELASCLSAARRGESDIVLGNLVGSNIFNVLGMLASASLLSPLSFPAAGIRTDLLVLLVLSLVLVPFLLTGRRIERWEGAALVIAYIAYVAWLFLR